MPDQTAERIRASRAVRVLEPNAVAEPTGELPPPLPEPDVSQPTSFLRFEPARPVWWYVLRMGAIAFFGAMMVGIALDPLLGGSERMVESIESDPWFFAFLAVFFTPPIETLVMALFFGVAGFFTKNVLRLAIASAVLWGALHVFNSPVNGVSVVWPFYIMSRAYLAWRPLGFWKAFGVTALIHATNNTVPAVLIVLFAEPPTAAPDPYFFTQ